jgi:hypothetical protein
MFNLLGLVACHFLSEDAIKEVSERKEKKESQLGADENT